MEIGTKVTAAVYRTLSVEVPSIAPIKFLTMILKNSHVLLTPDNVKKTASSQFQARMCPWNEMSAGVDLMPEKKYIAN